MQASCTSTQLVAKALPVIFHPEKYDGWLDGEFASACSLAAPLPSQQMRVD